MSRFLQVLVFSFALPTFAAPIGTIAELNAFLSGSSPVTNDFQLTGLVIFSRKGDIHSKAQSIILSDNTGRREFWTTLAPLPAVGQRIRLRGSACIRTDGRPWIFGNDLSADVLEHRPPPSLREFGVSEIREREHDLEPIRVVGTVMEVAHDEIDAMIDFLLIKDGTATLPVAIYRDQLKIASSLLDARISISGLYYCNTSGKRIFSGPYLDARTCTGLGEVRVIRPALADPCETPPLETNPTPTPQEIASMGRRSVEGTVLAVWNGNRLLIRTDRQSLINVELADGSKRPAVGAFVLIAGYPVTDLYQINLVKASCTTLRQPRLDTAAPISVPARCLLRDKKNRPCIKPDFHGEFISLAGEVKKLPTNPREPLVLACDDMLLSVTIPDETALPPNLILGCTVEVSGICVIEAETWHPYFVFPRIKGILLVIRSADDIRILARPPWWTPARLGAVIVTLLLALAAFIIWVRVLNRLVARRGRELFETQIAEASASLKVEERTRLAAELHDALSQNLSAVACQVSAAKSTASDNTETQSLLTTAERMLQSSRTELTRCLWDLRGDALEESDFTRAVENTLRRLSLAADIRVRFNVPRTCVDDTTAHAILCIVRELVTNASKHGNATEIHVAGEMHGNVLSFSVQDNGTGFDTACRKGIAEGHFGLEGIRDRVNRLDGTFDLTSSPGSGAKAVVNLTLKQESSLNEFNA